MKTYFICFALFALLLFDSCQKEIPGTHPLIQQLPLDKLRAPAPTAPNEYGAVLTNGRLAFKTREDYEKLVTNPSPEKEAGFMNWTDAQTGYLSHYRQQLLKRSEDPIRDDFFSSILNKEDIVQIANHIYKVDAQKEKVFALPVSEENQLNDLIQENTGNPNIRVFSTKEDVLEAIENNSNKWSIFCTEFWCPLQQKSKALNGTIVEANHLDLGLYFSLVSFIPTGSVNIYNFDAEFVYYKIRCDNTSGPYQLWNAQGAYDFWAAGQKLAIYQGSHNFSKLHFTVRGRDNSTSPPHYSEWVELRENA